MQMLKIVRVWRKKINAEKITDAQIEEFLKNEQEENAQKQECNEKNDEHAHIEDAEIVTPPETGEDMEVAHGGDDNVQDVEEAPAREEAEGENSEKESEGEPSEADSEKLEGESESQEAEEGKSDDSENNDSEKEGEVGSEKNEESEKSESGESEAEGEGSSEDSEKNEKSGDGESDDSEKEGESGESENNEDSDSQDNDSENDEPEEPGQENHNSAFDLAQKCKMSRIKNAVNQVISKVAEDLQGWAIEGEDEYNVHDIMMRKYNHRPLLSCTQSREKQSVVIILDSSGSCVSQASFFADVASAAANSGDVEMYNAPNGNIEGKFDKKHGWIFQILPWDFKNRTIIFFGDFDGGNYPVIASKSNKVYWFSCESRYEDMDKHKWCRFTLKDFKGKYYNCQAQEDFLRLVKKVR